MKKSILYLMVWTIALGSFFVFTHPSNAMIQKSGVSIPNEREQYIDTSAPIHISQPGMVVTYFIKCTKGKLKYSIIRNGYIIKQNELDSSVKGSTTGLFSEKGVYWIQLHAGSKGTAGSAQLFETVSRKTLKQLKQSCLCENCLLSRNLLTTSQSAVPYY